MIHEFYSHKKFGFRPLFIADAVAASLIGAGISAAASGAAAGIHGSMNRKTREQQQKQYEEQRDIQKAQYQQNFNWNKYVTETTWQREDNAYQRAVADAQAAGLSPLAVLDGNPSASDGGLSAPSPGALPNVDVSAGYDANGFADALRSFSDTVNDQVKHYEDTKTKRYGIDETTKRAIAGLEANLKSLDKKLEFEGRQAQMGRDAAADLQASSLEAQSTEAQKERTFRELEAQRDRDLKLRLATETLLAGLQDSNNRTSELFRRDVQDRFTELCGHKVRMKGFDQDDPDDYKRGKQYEAWWYRNYEQKLTAYLTATQTSTTKSTSTNSVNDSSSHSNKELNGEVGFGRDKTEKSSGPLGDIAGAIGSGLSKAVGVKAGIDGSISSESSTHNVSSNGNVTSSTTSSVGSKEYADFLSFIQKYPPMFWYKSSDYRKIDYNRDIRMYAD